MLVEDPDRPPAWFPAGDRGRRPDRAAGARRTRAGSRCRSASSLLRGLTLMESAPITTVAPTTTATALTSISTGLPPGEHGVIGYRMSVDRDILNVLRWTTAKGDAREVIPPESIQSRRRLRRSATAGGGARRVPRHRLHPGAPGRVPARAVPHALDDARRDHPPARARASRSSTPTTTASTRSPTSTA